MPVARRTRAAAKQEAALEGLSRTDLLDALTFVKSSLAVKDFIPILTHVCFTENEAMTYDDVLAHAAPCAFPVSCAVRGNLLLGLISNSHGKDVKVTEVADGIRLKCGRVTATLPTLKSDFIFEFPKRSKSALVVEDKTALADAFEQGLLGVDPVSGIPDFMNVILRGGATPTLVSTDSHMLARARLPLDLSHVKAPILLSTKFCRRLIEVLRAKQFAEDTLKLTIVADHQLLEATSGHKLYGRPLQFNATTDYDEVISSALGKKPQWVPLPKGFEYAVSRARVLVQEGTPNHRTISDDLTEFSLSDGKLTMFSQTAYGQLRDVFSVPYEGAEKSLAFDIRRVERAVHCTDHFALVNDAIAFKAGDTFLYMVATPKPAV